MNIEMINNHSANQLNDSEHITYGKPAFPDSRTKTEKMGFSLDITGTVRENAAYGKEELKSAEEIAQMAGMTDVSLQGDYMAVMSNSMSDEDFAKLMEDGINPAKIPAGETVTNLDRIKIRMAEAGTTIAGYNDDLTEEDIKAVLGNSINAGKIIADTLASADLPVSSDNISAVKETVMMADNLKPLTDEARAYMITEKLEPTVDNLYKAEYSAAAKVTTSDGVHFDGAATYAGSSITEQSWDLLKDQAEEVIREAGMDVTDDTVSDAKWIALHEIPLTTETINAYEQIKDIELPADPRDVIAAATVALEEGRSPKDADLTRTKSIYAKASEIVEHFMNMEDPEDLTRRRQLEEVRLVMTKEASLTLLKKGIEIETTPLEELVDKLREAEREFWKPVFTAGDGRSSDKIETSPEELDEKINLYKQTRQVISEIPHMPVRVIADRAGSEDFSLNSIKEAGEPLKAVYEKAGETYEALMTAPRADMGDSIRKAFRNVDDILTDLDMELNESNRKAVRTLGYAGMMINRESIDNIRNATHSVERVISLMTPAKTLSMIRDGYNPLSENIYELEKTLSTESFEEAGDKYSRFLLKLEKSGNITEDEKRTFIGMYRLFDKIEKQDGRVIGNILSSGMDLTLENMLKAYRSNRHTDNEYVIDDDFGLLERAVEKGETITSQLERTFDQLIASEPAKEYIEQKQREIREAGRYSKEAEDILISISEPVTAENILAVNVLTGGMGPGYKKMFSRERSSKDDDNGSRREVLSEEDARELADGFDDRESAVAAYERFLEKAGKVAAARTMESDLYEDVREYSMIYKQVGFAASLAGRESYEVPVLLEDGWTSIHLTIEHKNGESGKVRASFDSDAYGRVEASFVLKERGVDGLVVSDSRAGVDNLKLIDDKIKEGFHRENMETANLSYVFSRNRGNESHIPGTDNPAPSNRSLYRIAKAFIGAIQTV